MLYLNTFKDKHYPSALVVLGAIAFVAFITLVYSFFSGHWVIGIISSIIMLGLTFVVIFCVKRRSFSIKEERNKQKEASDEKEV